MMDLLVKVATYNKIVPSGHVIKVFSDERRNVFYKPNTPVGLLDANTLYVVPKSAAEASVKRMPKLANQPFETFRLQINLPRNQRAVLRVSPQMTLAELKRQICEDKELDPSMHHLVHPSQPDVTLDLSSTLDIYGCAEISLLSNSGLRESIRCLSTQLITLPQGFEEEKRKKGILRLFSKKKKELPSENDAAVECERHVSVSAQDNGLPKQSIKRKQAPAPPVLLSSAQQNSQNSNALKLQPSSEAKSDELGSTVSHSRHSSDSSGYHEPSVFSDCSENKSPESSIVQGIVANDMSKGHVHGSKSHTKHRNIPTDLTHLKSVPLQSAVISACRKRKAPQPPTPVLHEVEDVVALKESTVEDPAQLLRDSVVPFSAGHLVEVIAETHSEPCDSAIAIVLAEEQVEEDVVEEEGLECVESAGACEDGVRCKETPLSNGNIPVPDIELSEGNLEVSTPLTNDPLMPEIVAQEETGEIVSGATEVTESENFVSDNRVLCETAENSASVEVQENVSESDVLDCVESATSKETTIVLEEETNASSLIPQKLPNFVMRCYGDKIEEVSEVFEKKKVLPVLVGYRSAPQVQVIPFEERKAMMDKSGSISCRRRRSSSVENICCDVISRNSVIANASAASGSVKRTISEQNINTSLVEDIGREQPLLLRSDSGVQSGFFSVCPEVPTDVQCSVTQGEMQINASLPSLNHTSTSSLSYYDCRKVLSEDNLKTCTLPRVSISHHKPTVIFSTFTANLSSEGKSRHNGESQAAPNSSNESTEMPDPFKRPTLPARVCNMAQNTKSETLPRPMTRSKSAFDTPKSETLKRDNSTNSQLVTIGSWDQRNAPNVKSDTASSSHSMFQSLENVHIAKQHKAPLSIQRSAATETVTVNGHGNKDKHHATVIPSISISVKEVHKKNLEKHSIGNNSRNHVPKHETTKLQQARGVQKTSAKEMIKSSKPLVRLLSMKDEPQPSRSLCVLKKWPLPETNCSKRGNESVAGEDHSRMTKHAEVNLRKMRSSKSSSTVSPQSSSSTEHTEQHGIKADTSDVSSDSGSSSNRVSKPPVNVTFLQHSVQGREKFNIELKNIISKRATLQKESVSSSDSEPTYSEATSNNTSDNKVSQTNGNTVPPPPPPPPPVSTMPPIPAAVPIPLSSQLLMQKKTGVSREVPLKDPKKPKTSPGIAPRDELMLEIRGFGGRQALRKVQLHEPSWNLKVFGPKTVMNC